MKEIGSDTFQDLRISNNSWCSEKLLSFFSAEFSTQLSLEAQEMIKKRQLLDFFIQPGKVSARIEEETAQAHRVEISFDKLSEETWEKILVDLSKNAYFIASLLAGKLPVEIQSLFDSYNASLCPSSLNDINITFDYNEITKMLPCVCALVFRLCEKLDKDPFIIFLLRGKGRDEILSRIHKYRSEMWNSQKHLYATSSLKQTHFNKTALPLSETIENYWLCKKALWEISYDIKEDELPSSILKWLDLPPLLGLETEAELQLELAYEKVTRLAQGLGLTYNNK